MDFCSVLVADCDYLKFYFLSTETLLNYKQLTTTYGRQS